MIEENENINAEEKQNDKETSSKPSFFRGVLDGTIIAREGFLNQVPFILFLSALAIIYIANRYHAESVVREQSTLQKEIKELRSEAITTDSELMKLNRQTEVFKMVEKRKLGLYESLEPPTKIAIED